MHFDELKQLFFDAFQSPVLKRSISRPPQKPKTDNSYKHFLYPISALPALIDTLQGLDPDDGYNEKFSVRYIVLEGGTLLLAREGAPGRSIPAHREMGLRSLAAGNIYFSPDYQFITRINHQSGDFHSTQGSLVWPLAVLILTNTTLSSSFTIDISNVDRYGEFKTEALFNLSHEKLYSLLPEGIEAIVVPSNVDGTVVINEFNDSRKPNSSMAFFNVPELTIVPPLLTPPIDYTTPPTTPR